MTLFVHMFAVFSFIASAGLTPIVWSESSPRAQLAQTEHSHTKPATPPGSHNSKKQDSKASPTRLRPAEEASVKILSPKPGQTIKGDHVPLQFKLVKGKKGHHVHAYVDGELMGMFESDKGTLTGVKTGKHTLELRVVADDHQTELDARDSVHFMVK